jgi:hypothetical protein
MGSDAGIAWPTGEMFTAGRSTFPCSVRMWRTRAEQRPRLVPQSPVAIAGFFGLIRMSGPGEIRRGPTAVNSAASARKPLGKANVALRPRPASTTTG